MTIALSAELLLKIANSTPKFENECIGLKDDLLELGKTFNSKIEAEKMDFAKVPFCNVGLILQRRVAHQILLLDKLGSRD